MGAHQVRRESLGRGRAHGRRRRRDRRAAGLSRRLVRLVAAGAARGARRRRDPGAVRAGPRRQEPQGDQDAGSPGAAGPARRADHEPQVRGREGGEVPPRGRVPRARHRAGRPAPRRRPAGARARRRGPRRRRARHGRRRRVSGPGLVGRRRARAADGRHPRGHAQPLRPRHRPRPRRRGRRPGRLRRRPGADHRPRGRERPCVRQQRLSGPVRRDRELPRVSRQQAGGHAVGAAGDARARQRPFDLRFDTPDGARQEGAHVIQVSNGPYGTTPTTLTSRPRLDTGELGVLTLVVPDAASATRAVAAVATSKPQIYEGYKTWSAPAFEVTSGAPDPGRPRRRVARAGPAAGVPLAAGRAAAAPAQARDRLLTGRARHAPARPRASCGA